MGALLVRWRAGSRRRVADRSRTGRSRLVRRPQTFTGSSHAQTTPRRVAALANTPGMSVGRRLARRRLDHAITPATFVATALDLGPGHAEELGAPVLVGA